MTDPAEKRVHPRVEIILKVEYLSPSDFLSDHALNLSEGGIFIATERNIPVGEKLSFSLSFPGLMQPLSSLGEVRWRRSPEQADERNPAGIGVAFLFGSEEEAQRIRAIVRSIIELRRGRDEPAPGRRILRVLLAEDNPMVRDMVRFAVCKFHKTRIGASSPLDVVEADDGRKAVEALERQGPFDLAIIDYYMPILGGGQLVRRIRQTEAIRDLPVIVISGGGDDVKADSYEAGADLYLGKPVLINQLFESMQKLLHIGSGTGGR